MSGLLVVISEADLNKRGRIIGSWEYTVAGDDDSSWTWMRAVFKTSKSQNLRSCPMTCVQVRSELPKFALVFYRGGDTIVKLIEKLVVAVSSEARAYQSSPVREATKLPWIDLLLPPILALL